MKLQNLNFEIETDTELALENVVGRLKTLLKAPDILFLNGEMASGKTTLVRNLSESFGLQMVQSPTYAIHQRYQNQDIKIDHLDLYRIENEEQLETVGLWDLFQEKDNLILIEWADRLDEKSYPLDRRIFQLQINVLESSKRLYQLFQLT
ncbi:MAG: tRNA (adenosine(37)-N6)-threonylcarbamoyltransferase complex ATPase subunit type 1 TsaE [Bdellovibrionaceae bacterium]|nr:tRNA (adenosine(37)-N6)-threonylcarbamoyltransferase complex ATPase subunit type 1 TsaE [Bdellovibrio sp.]